jgi:hypothetical protein
MAVFIESPWPFLLLGIAIEAVLAVMLLQTGRGKLLWAMVGVAILTLLGLVVEHFVITDRKAVANTLDACAAAIEKNNIDQTLGCISSQAPRTQSDARWVLGRFQFSKARISGLEVTINRMTSPPTARATFTAIGTCTDRKGEMPYNSFARQVTVTLHRENNRWLVGEYSVEDFQMPSGR